MITRRVRGVLPGDRLAAGVGSGTELAQLRPYEVGDDVRQIDAAATARMGEPYVRLHVPERTLTTWLPGAGPAPVAFGATRPGPRAGGGGAGGGVAGPGGGG